MKTIANIFLGLYFSVLYSESLILPGTNFCGAGELEEKDDLLGPFYPGTDNCCRHHDSCPVKIDQFSQKFELYNYYPYTISLCQCDEAFRSCLQQDGSQMSAKIGQMYFNILKTPCFELKQDMICQQKNILGQMYQRSKRPKSGIEKCQEVLK